MIIDPSPSSARSRPLRIGAHKFAEALFVHRAGGKFKYCLRRRFLAGRETITIEFQKQNADDEPRSLVAVKERVILHDAGCVRSRKLDNIGACVCVVIERTTECGLKKSLITQTRRTAMLNKLSIMNREHKLLLDPNRLAHFDRT
jgi:hypothetical protein